MSGITNGIHDSRELETGETVHLVRYPEGNWHISSYEWRWANGLNLSTIQVLAQKVKWEGLAFDASEEAYSFVLQQLKSGKIPCKARQARDNLVGGARL